MKRTAPAALALLLGLALTGCSSDDPDDPDGTPAAAAESNVAGSATAAGEPGSSAPAPAEGAAAAADGAFIDRAEYEADPAGYHEAGDVVLFFSATWCPTCQASVNSLNTDGVPPGLAVVSVDYDTATDLRQQYGVTVQHTYVQVDQSGRELAKWTGSVSGEDIAEQTV